MEDGDTEAADMEDGDTDADIAVTGEDGDTDADIAVTEDADTDAANRYRGRPLIRRLTDMIQRIQTLTDTEDAC